MYQPTPKITLLMLADYLTDRPGGRRRILQSRANTPESFFRWHRRIRPKLVEFLVRGAGTAQEYLLHDAGLEFRDAEAISTRDRADLDRASQAMQLFGDSYSKVKLGTRLRTPPEGVGERTISGVIVSVEPDLIVFDDANEPKAVGALIFRCVATRKMRPRAAAYATTLLRVHLMEMFEGTDFVVDAELCQIFDVFRQEVYSAPDAYKQSMVDITEGCDEIRRAWPPPPEAPSERGTPEPPPPSAPRTVV